MTSTSGDFVVTSSYSDETCPVEKENIPEQESKTPIEIKASETEVLKKNLLTRLTLNRRKRQLNPCWLQKKPYRSPYKIHQPHHSAKKYSKSSWNIFYQNEQLLLDCHLSTLPAFKLSISALNVIEQYFSLKLRNYLHSLSYFGIK